MKYVRLVGALVACLSLLGCSGPSAPPATDTVSVGELGEVFQEIEGLRRSGANPGLYALDCAIARELEFRSGTTPEPASLAGQGARIVDDRLVLPAGEGVYSVTVRSDAGAGTVWVRCLPEGFPEFSVTGAFTSELALTTANRDAMRPGFQVVLDSSGFPIWVREHDGALADFYVHDDAVLSFTTRPLPVGPYYNQPGFGYQLEEFDGTTRTSWVASREYGPDFHAAEVLPNGNLLTILYEPAKTASLAALGKLRSDPQVQSVKSCPSAVAGPDAEVVRGSIAEIEPGGVVRRTWHVADVLPVPVNPGWVNINGPGEPARCVVDADHLNAVSFLQDPNRPAGEGAVLVGGRHLNGAVLLDWPSGQVRWTLGTGESAQSLRILDDPLRGPRLAHDARLLDAEHVSFYDNRANWDGSRAVVYRVDPVAQTATLEETYTTSCGPSPCVSIALGSVRPTARDSVLVSWGIPAPFLASEISRRTGSVTATLKAVDDGAYRVLPVQAESVALLRSQQR